jgi:hypothetical protein
MKLRLLAPCLFFVLASVVTRAQIGLYVNPIATDITNSQADSGTFAFLGTGVTSRTFWGVNIGAYYDVSRSKSATLGIDVRDSIVRGNGAKLNSFLVGPRIASAPLDGKFKPYIEPVIGAGSSRPATNPASVTNFQWGVFGGVDYVLNRYVDFRMVEVGYGRVTTVSSGDYEGPNTFPASRLISISAGLVFRIP